MEHESQFRIIYLYQILNRYSDAEHPLSTNQIVQMMDEQHNIKMHRTTVPKDISVLNECGIEVLEVRARDKKYYLNERTSETDELKTPVDAAETSSYFSEEKSLAGTNLSECMLERKLTVYIQDLDMSQRSIKVLLRNGITTLNKLESCDLDEIKSFKGLGKNSLKEICGILDQKDKIFEAFEERIELINKVPEDICNIEISELGVSTRALNALTRVQINTVGDLIHTSKHDISAIYNIGDKTRDEIYNLIEMILSSDGDRDRILSFAKAGEEVQAAGKEFDFDTIDILTGEFSMPPSRMTGWFGLSKQGIYNVLTVRSNKRRQKWTGKELNESEHDILLNLIQNKSFEYTDNEVQCHCFNNRKDDFAAVFVYEDEIKCFFLNSMPDELKTLIIEANLHKYTENELSGGSDGSVFYFLKQPYFTPKDLKKFTSNANYRKMTLDEYSRFLTGYPYSVPRVYTDEQIIEFLENSLVDGKVYISSNPQNYWFRSLASKNGFTFKEFVEFYGYEYSFRGQKLTDEAAQQRHIQELQKYVVDGNTIYLPSDSRAYTNVNAYAHSRGISINDYIKSLGFERTPTPPEKQSFELEEDTQVHD